MIIEKRFEKSCLALIYSRMFVVPLSEHYKKHGEEYVKWNILYANKNAKKSYGVYLQKALVENWAEEWQEEEKAKIQAQQEAEEKRQQELAKQNRKEELEKQAAKQREQFKQSVSLLSETVKHELWLKAEQTIPEDAFRRVFAVKIQYAELLLGHLNANGEDFIREVVADLGFIADIAWQ